MTGPKLDALALSAQAGDQQALNAFLTELSVSISGAI